MSTTRTRLSKCPRLAWKSWAMALSLAVLAHGAQAQPPRELDGVAIDESATVSGTRLVLNGAAIQKRGFFKTNTCALYLPEKTHSLDEIIKLAGPKRVHLVMLRDVAGFLIARQFLADFAANASESEAAAMTAEVEAIAAGYVKIEVLHKGDVVLIDWIPGEGIVSTLNGKSMGPAHNNEPLFDVSLRPVMGRMAPRELREQLLDLN